MGYTVYIILVPMVMFLFIGLGSKWLRPRAAGLCGTLGMAVSALLSYLTAYRYFFVEGLEGDAYRALTAWSAQWLRFSDTLHIDMGVLLDPISVMMLVVITTVSLMVHIYSFGYMKGERGFQRYYAFLSLFSFSMLGLVVATNIFQMYIFWELVGASSYLLIGFYYTKPAAIAASKKAFIVTRFADLGFLIGILILSFYTGTFDFGLLTADNASLAVTSLAGGSFLGLSAATWAMALLFMGAAGKSAMFPLHIWLPDAWRVRRRCRAHPCRHDGGGGRLPYRADVPALLFRRARCTHADNLRGCFHGAFCRGHRHHADRHQTGIGLFHHFADSLYDGRARRVGYGRSCRRGLYGSMFHLFTHAFFKALLFLGAGAVIHAVHSNEMEAMGGLRKYLPVTHITFLVACFSIAGIPPFSGFFSKDEILSAAFGHDKFIFAVLLLVAGLTAFYMFRLYFRIFWGTERKYEVRPHEAPASMLVPLVFLALLSCVTGWLPFSRLVSSDGIPYRLDIDWAIAAGGILVSLAGIAWRHASICGSGDWPRGSPRSGPVFGGRLPSLLYR